MDDVTFLGLCEDEEIELDDGALRLAALDHPGVDLQPYLDVLDAVAERLAMLDDDASAIGRAELLARVIADEFGFSGDRDSYDLPDNADLIRVIDRRRGLPVSLAILYVAAARRLGWQAEILGVPGHVLVRIGPEVDSVLVDPFHAGIIVDHDQLAALIGSMLGLGTRPQAEHLAPLANRAVLVRLLTNQATRAEAGHDRPRALALYTRITAIAPTNGPARWERARLELAAGDVAASRASLGAMLETTRDPRQRERVVAALEALSDRR